MLVDSHCHLDRLDLAAHDGSLDAALDAARERGVGHFLCIGVSADNAADVKALAERYDDVDCSVGVHPLDVQPGAAPALDWLLHELNHPKVVAIGETGLDYHYEPEARNARTVDGNPFLWARNLLANRLYDCPVIFLEPYVMNSRTDYARIQAGDYEGLRKIDGRERPSIFREYADALARGLAQHYRRMRQAQ